MLYILLSYLDFTSGARWQEAVKNHRHTSREAKRRRVTSFRGGMSETEKSVRWVRGPGKWMCPPAFFVFLWAGAPTPFHMPVSQWNWRASKA